MVRTEDTKKLKNKCPIKMPNSQNRKYPNKMPTVMKMPNSQNRNDPNKMPNSQNRNDPNKMPTVMKMPNSQPTLRKKRNKTQY